MADPAKADGNGNGWLRAALVYFEPRVLYVALLGFSSGLPLALTGSTLQAWMTQAGVNLGTIGLFALVGLPYTLKFVWAPLVDAVRLPVLTKLFGRRRGWLIASQFALAATLFFLGRINPSETPMLLAAIALTVAFISATQDIMVDTIRIEVLDDRQQAAGVANYVAAYRVAMLVTTSGALVAVGFLAKAGWDVSQSWGAIYTVFGLAMGVGLLGAFLMPEPDAPEDAASLSGRTAIMFFGGLGVFVAGLFYLRTIFPSGYGRYYGLTVLAIVAAFALVAFLWQRSRLRSGQVSALGQQIQKTIIAPFSGFAVDHRHWLALLFLVILFKFGDSFAGSLFTPFGLRLGFEAQQLGYAVGWGIIATIAGGFLGAYILRWLGLLAAMWVAGIVQLISNFGYFALALIGPNEVALLLAVLVENVMGGIGTTIFIALISSLCRNKLYTATQFALLTALSAVPRTLLVAPAGYVAQWVGWPTFFVLSAIAALPGIALLWWLGVRGAIAEKTAELSG